MSFDDVELNLKNQYTLCCPACGSAWAHHGAVTVYTRREEDGAATKTCVLPDGTVQQNIGKHHNPSGRRDGLAIQFYCEQGCGPIELTIEQHKGICTLGWRELTDPPAGTLMLPKARMRTA
jgi:hypothetical protein